MNKLKKFKRSLYYTLDHEWIDFQGSVAYIGVGSFKLKGLKEVIQVRVISNQGSNKKGEQIATVQFEGKEIPVRLPVDGRVISFNDLILGTRQNLILEEPENNGWVAMISPNVLHERKGLLHEDEYKRLIGRKK